MKNQDHGFGNGEEDTVLFTSSLGFESSSLLGGGGYETEIVHIKEDTDDSGDMGEGRKEGTNTSIGELGNLPGECGQGRQH